MANDAFQNEPELADFQLLAVRYLEGQLDDEELVELNAQLRADRGKRKHFVRLCHLRAGVIEEANKQFTFEKDQAVNLSDFDIRKSFVAGDMNESMVAPALSPESIDSPEDQPLPGPLPLPRPAPPQPKTLPGWTKAAMIALPLLLGILVWAISRNNNHPQQLAVKSHDIVTPQIAPPAVVIPAGVITAAVDAQWDPTEPKIELNHSLVDGGHTLINGAVEIKMSGGASVVVQGPAHFQLDTGSHITLNRGKISALLSHGESNALTVVTPDMTAVDLGTEFGLDVRFGEQTHLEVFQGHVRAEVPTGTLQSSQQIVDANQAVVAIKGSNLIKPVPATPLAFVRAGELNTVSDSASSPYLRWQSFSRMLRQDPELLAYYPFDNQAEAPRQLLNRATATLGQHIGTLGATTSTGDGVPEWVPGRWPEKLALRFGRTQPSSVVSLSEPDTLIPKKALSIGCWLMRDDLAKSVHLLNGTVDNVTQFNLNLLGTVGKSALKLNSNTLYFSWNQKDIGSAPLLPRDNRWYFAMITAANGGPTRFYVDGKLISSVETSMSEILPLQSFVIGRGVLGNKDVDVRDSFHGAMDELMIFSRTLSDEEITRIYQAGGHF